MWEKQGLLHISEKLTCLQSCPKHLPSPVKTTITRGLKIQHQTACVLNKMEYKVLPPALKHDSQSPLLRFSRLPPVLLLHSGLKRNGTRVVATIRALRGEVVRGLVMDSHSDKHKL